MDDHYNSKHSDHKNSNHRRKRQQKIRQSGDMNQNDGFKISKEIVDLRILLEIYRKSILYLQRNKGRITDRICYECDIAERLDTIRSKANTVYLFATDYMKKNLPTMLHEVTRLIDEYEDVIKAKNKDHFVYHIPFLSICLYEKEKGELRAAIDRIERVYLTNIRVILKLYDEIYNIIRELDKYYDIFSS